MQQGILFTINTVYSLSFPLYPSLLSFYFSLSLLFVYFVFVPSFHIFFFPSLSILYSLSMVLPCYIIFVQCNKSWIFKLISAATKKWIFKRKMAVQETLQAHWQQYMTTVTEPGWVFSAHHCHFSLKIAIKWSAFKISSLEAVEASWFKDLALFLSW